MSELKIDYLPLDKIKPYKGNAKEHPKAQIEQIKESIKDFGFNDPIAVWGKENTIIEGHGRYLAAKALNIEKVPVIRLDNLTDEQRKAYALIHNKLTMNSDFDLDALQEELDAINNYDMSIFGFDDIDKDIQEIEQKEDEPEIQFTEVLGEEHNYIVLYFDNEIDWLQLQSLIDVDGKMNLSTRKDGKIGSSMKRVSVGRVFNGREVLERLREHYEDFN